MKVVTDIPTYTASNIGAEALNIITTFMTPEQKSFWLWTHSDFPKPTIGRDGLIVVDDPNGTTHYVTHTKHEGIDEFQCIHHGACFGAAHAARAYRLNSGEQYERNTGNSIFMLTPSGAE